MSYRKAKVIVCGPKEGRLKVIAALQIIKQTSEFMSMYYKCILSPVYQSDFNMVT